MRLILNSIKKNIVEFFQGFYHGLISLHFRGWHKYNILNFFIVVLLRIFFSLSFELWRFIRRNFLNWRLFLNKDFYWFILKESLVIYFFPLFFIVFFLIKLFYIFIIILIRIFFIILASTVEYISTFIKPDDIDTFDGFVYLLKLIERYYKQFEDFHYDNKVLLGYKITSFDFFLVIFYAIFVIIIYDRYIEPPIIKFLVWLIESVTQYIIIPFLDFLTYIDEVFFGIYCEKFFFEFSAKKRALILQKLHWYILQLIFYVFYFIAYSIVWIIYKILCFFLLIFLSILYVFFRIFLVLRKFFVFLKSYSRYSFFRKGILRFFLYFLKGFFYPFFLMKNVFLYILHFVYHYLIRYTCILILAIAKFFYLENLVYFIFLYFYILIMGSFLFVFKFLCIDTKEENLETVLKTAYAALKLAFYSIISSISFLIFIIVNFTKEDLDLIYLDIFAFYYIYNYKIKVTFFEFKKLFNLLFKEFFGIK